MNDPAPVAQDRDAFARLLQTRYRSQLLRIMYRWADGDRLWAEDVVQETMVRAWRHADDLQAGGYPSLLPWLVTVARRVAINDRRALRRHVLASPDELAGLPTPDPTELALQRTLIGAARSRLSKPHCDVVVAIYLQGHAMHEVAGALNIPLGTVKSRLHHALRAMRATLATAR